MSNIIPVGGTLSDLADKINDEHRAAEAALRTGLMHARNAGMLLRDAKAKVSHGAWIPWLKKNCEFSERTAQLYMRVASRWAELEAKAQRVSDLSFRDGIRLLTTAQEDGSLSESPQVN